MVHRFKIEVDGTGILEYYELEHCSSEETAKQTWLSDVAERWGAGVATAFEGRVRVKMLTDKPPELPAPDNSNQLKK